MSNFEIHSLPVLTDNYIHVVQVDSSRAVVIDPAVSDPVEEFLARKSWQLTHILITHHHSDHTSGVQGLKAAYPNCKVIGFTNDAHRLPQLTNQVSEGDHITIGQLAFDVWHLPGHTTGHIAYI